MDPVSALLLIPMTLAAAAYGFSCAARAVPAEPPPQAPVPVAVQRMSPAVVADGLDARLATLDRSEPIEAARAARKAVTDEEPRLRLVGARFLRRGDVLADLAQATWVEDDVRVAALGALDKAGLSHALQALATCMADGSPAVRLAAARLAERIHDPATLPVLCRSLQDLVPRWADADAATLDLTVALTRAFARLSGAPVEYALIRIADGPSREARAVAYAGLARSGTRRCVPVLERAAAERDPALREAARSALAAVRFRTGDVRGGAVSLSRTRPTAGALSLSRIP